MQEIVDEIYLKMTSNINNNAIPILIAAKLLSSGEMTIKEYLLKLAKLDKLPDEFYELLNADSVLEMRGILSSMGGGILTNLLRKDDVFYALECLVIESFKANVISRDEAIRFGYYELWLGSDHKDDYSIWCVLDCDLDLIRASQNDACNILKKNDEDDFMNALIEAGKY